MTDPPFRMETASTTNKAARPGDPDRLLGEHERQEVRPLALVLIIVGQTHVTHIGNLRANLHDLAAIGHFTRPCRLGTNGHFDLVIDEISPLQMRVLLIIGAHLAGPDVSETSIIDLDREELPFLALALALLYHAFHRAQTLDDTG